MASTSSGVTVRTISIAGSGTAEDGSADTRHPSLVSGLDALCDAEL
jgi:hypothetical protein